ncbi:hypothetical protein ACFWF2_27255, partial [Nocardia sp. NPDC060259]
DPYRILGELLQEAGFDEPSIPATIEARSARWRSWLADRRALLLFDNVRDAAQVEPLLPGSDAQCCTLITSRHPLDRLSSTIRIDLNVLSAHSAEGLLRQIAHHGIADKSISDYPEEVDPAFTDLARLCGYLPLALQSIGAKLHHGMTAGDLSALMSDADHPYDEVPDLESAVSTAFRVSYEALPDPARSLLRACALHPGPDFDAYSIASLISRNPVQIKLGLVDLAAHGMLTPIPHARYKFHDLFLGFARERLHQLVIGVRGQLVTVDLTPDDDDVGSIGDDRGR